MTFGTSAAKAFLSIVLGASASLAAASDVRVSKQRLDDGRHVLVHEVVVDAPLAKVWTAISTADGWKGWAAPAAWDRAPDVLETSYDKAAKPNDGTTIRQQILFRAPQRLFAFRTVKAPDGFPDIATYSQVTNLFELEPIGEGRTRVRLTGSAYADTDAGRKLLTFFEAGNSVSLASLRDALRGGAAAPSPTKALEPLSFLAGHCWAGEFPKTRQIDTHCFEPMHGGQHLRDRHEVKDQGGKTVYAGETIYAWNGRSKRIEFAYFSSDGGVSYGSVSPRDGGVLDFGDETYNGPDGKELKISTIWRRAGADAYDAISRSGFNPTGERVVRYTRILAQ